MLSDHQQHDVRYQDLVSKARQMTLEERFCAGPRLFDLACESSKAQLRREHPHATEDVILALLRARVALGQLPELTILDLDDTRKP